MTFRKRVWVLVLLLAAAAGYTHLLADVHAVPLSRPLSSIPTVLGAWKSVRAVTMEDAILKVVGVEDYLFRDYTDAAGYPVNAYVGYYEAQREGDTAHSPKQCLPGAGWTQLENRVIAFPTPGFNGGTTRANRYEIAKGEQRQLVLYWYQGRGRDIANEYAAKFYLVVDSIFRKRSDGTLIRLMVPIQRGAGAEIAEQRAVDFARLFLPELGKVLPE